MAMKQKIFTSVRSALSPKRLGLFLLLVGVATIPAFFSYAELSAITFDIGGYKEKFKGGGDKEPPRCQVDIPAFSTEPFFIKWNCEDNWANQEDIRSEVWIYRKDAPRGVLVAQFLGFPASLLVDEGLLQLTEEQEFVDALPVNFRIVATDRAGITTLSPFLTVADTASSLNFCTLTVVTEETESDEETVGLPSMTVLLESEEVLYRRLSPDSFEIILGDPVVADPCEVDELCVNDAALTFEAQFLIASEESASGKVIISPTDSVVDVTGTATLDGDLLTAVSLTGLTTVDGVTAEVELLCGQ